MNTHEAAKRHAAERYLALYDSAPRHYIRSALGALSGALTGASLWAMMGASRLFVHVWVSVVIVLLVSSCYDHCKGRPGKLKIAEIIIFTLVGMIFGELMLSFISILSNSDLTSLRIRMGTNVLDFYNYNFKEYCRVGINNILIGCTFALPMIVKIGLDMDGELAGIRRLRESLNEVNCEHTDDK